MTSGHGFIDVHGHFLTPAYMKALERAGIRDIDGYPMPEWSAAAALDVMDRFGIAATVLSISAPGVYFLQGKAAAGLSRSLNEAAREIVDAHPRRFAALAAVPMQEPDAALAEIAYALDVLKLDGVGLFSNYGGAYLGDRCFDPVFAELNRRRAVVFTHPAAPPAFKEIGLDFSAPLIEFLFDTTRMIANLAASGTLTRCADLKMIVSHGGGTLPFIAPRVARILAALPTDSPRRSSEQRPGTAHAYRAAMQSLFYDVTSICHPAALLALRELVPAEHILTGFDFPFMRPENISLARDGLAGFFADRPAEMAAIGYGNARRLFPGLTARMDAVG